MSRLTSLGDRNRMQHISGRLADAAKSYGYLWYTSGVFSLYRIWYPSFIDFEHLTASDSVSRSASDQGLWPSQHVVKRTPV
jgi:hypothetical protein